MSATLLVLGFEGLLIAVAVYAVNTQMYSKKKRDAHEDSNN